MATIRRHWKAFLLSLTMLAVVGCWLLFSNLSAVPAIGEEPQADTNQDANEAVQQIDPGTYSQIQALRRRLSLANEDLAAMGCSKEGATSILETLLSWHEANKENLDAAGHSKRNAAKDLRQALRRVNIGPRDQNVLESLPGLKSAYAAAVQSEGQLVESLVQPISSLLSDGQQATWNATRKNAGLPSPYRYLSDLSSSQKAGLTRALQIRGRKLAYSQDSPGELPSLTDCLSYAQKSELEAVRTTVNTKMPGVLKACWLVFPRPEGFVRDSTVVTSE